MRPFLKWAGGKYQIIDRISSVLPLGHRLIEPFAGSAAVFLNVRCYESYLVSDINHDLISLYKVLQREGEAFIDYCATLFKPEHNNQEVYYSLREYFNDLPYGRERSALFLYLNRHGYNGLCRYNGKGKFNTPFGKYTAPYFPRKELADFFVKSQRADFLCADFLDVMDMAVEGDVVYCDPPYVPLSKTAGFTSYSGGGFGIKEQEQLAQKAIELSGRGVTVVISNHETEFVLQAYAPAKIHKFDVRRSISCQGDGRGTAKEVLAVFAA